jgi:hypothetical protein
MIERTTCKECGARVIDSFRSKWRHMVRKHPDHMVRKILPLVFLPAEELRQIGVDIAHSFLRKIQK